MLTSIVFGIEPGYLNKNNTAIHVTLIKLLLIDT